MKNYQKGSVVVVAIIIVLLLLIGSGIYVYTQKSVSSSNSSVAQNVPVITQTVATSPVTSVSPIMSDNDSIIQAILNAKNIWSSGDATKIRAYALIEYADNPKFLAQTKSASDATLLSTAAITAKVYDKIDGTFLKANCKITITGNTAKCSWNPTPSSANFTQSITVKKINGVWQ